jgi:hypothetical protein
VVVWCAMAVARTRNGTEFEPHTAVFPILVEEDAETSRLVGTGFFLSTIGHFITAKHVFEEAFDFESGRQIRPIHALHFVREAEVLVRAITKVCVTNNNDLAVARLDFHVDNATNQSLRNRVPRCTLEHPQPGSRIIHTHIPKAHDCLERETVPHHSI